MTIITNNNKYNNNDNSYSRLYRAHGRNGVLTQVVQVFGSVYVAPFLLCLTFSLIGGSTQQGVSLDFVNEALTKRLSLCLQVPF